MVDLEKEVMVIARNIVKDSMGQVLLLEALPIAVQIQRNRIMLHISEKDECVVTREIQDTLSNKSRRAYN